MLTYFKRLRRKLVCHFPSVNGWAKPTNMCAIEVWKCVFAQWDWYVFLTDTSICYISIANDHYLTFNTMWTFLRCSLAVIIKAFDVQLNYLMFYFLNVRYMYFYICEYLALKRGDALKSAFNIDIIVIPVYSPRVIHRFYIQNTRVWLIHQFDYVNAYVWLFRFRFDFVLNLKSWSLDMERHMTSLISISLCLIKQSMKRMNCVSQSAILGRFCI